MRIIISAIFKEKMDKYNNGSRPIDRIGLHRTEISRDKSGEKLKYKYEMKLRKKVREDKN